MHAYVASVSRQLLNTFQKLNITSHHNNAELFVVDMEIKFHKCDAFVRHTIVSEARDVAHHLLNTGTCYRTPVYF